VASPETPSDWQLELSGVVADKAPWTIDKLRSLPQEEVTRHIYIEGWSQIGPWSGVPQHVFLSQIGADLKARYVSLKCFDDYSASIDMPSALHPQTVLALDFLHAARLVPGAAVVTLTVVYARMLMCAVSVLLWPQRRRAVPPACPDWRREAGP
jgi:Oxidoreductase molybdopterin binding domain